MSSDTEKLHIDIVTFLAAEFRRPNAAQCIRLDLLYSAGTGFRDDEIQSWVREESPEIFETLALIEKLTTTILERAELHADALQPGKHRFILRTKQFLGGKSTFSFSMQPSGALASEDSQMALLGGGPKNANDALVAGFNIQVRANQQMHQGTVQSLMSTNKYALEELVRLREENHSLRRRVDDAESAKHEREWRMRKEDNQGARSDKMLAELFGFGKLALTKALGGPEGKDAAPTRLVILLKQLKDSIQERQVMQLQQVFEQSQLMLFIEVMTIVEAMQPDETPAATGSAPSDSKAS